MNPYTHTDATGTDIKVHTNDVYTLVTIDGHEVMLTPEATGELLIWMVENSVLSRDWKEKAAHRLECTAPDGVTPSP